MRVRHQRERCLYVADLERAVAFYRRVLAFELMLTEERMAALAVPGGSVLLCRCGGFVEPGVACGTIPRHDEQGAQHWCFAGSLAEIVGWPAHLAACDIAGPGLWAVF